MIKQGRPGEAVGIVAVWLSLACRTHPAVQWTKYIEIVPASRNCALVAIPTRWNVKVERRSHARAALPISRLSMRLLSGRSILTVTTAALVVLF